MVRAVPTRPRACCRRCTTRISRRTACTSRRRRGLCSECDYWECHVPNMDGTLDAQLMGDLRCTWWSSSLPGLHLRPRADGPEVPVEHMIDSDCGASYGSGATVRSSATVALPTGVAPRLPCAAPTGGAAGLTRRTGVRHGVLVRCERWGWRSAFASGALQDGPRGVC